MRGIIAVLAAIIIGIALISRPDSLTEMENAEQTALSLKHLRVSLEQYYQEYKIYPENLVQDEKFMEIYGKTDLDGTRSRGDSKENNEVHITEDFKEVTDDGGWNYNPKTGEIRANLDFDCFHQKIDWHVM